MRAGAWAAVAAAAAAAVNAPRAHADPPGCGVNLSAPAIQAAINSLQTNVGEWDPKPAAGNYNPCATLSTVEIHLKNATAGMPHHALLFHNGDYVGTATPNPYHYMHWNPGQTTDDTVVLDYHDPLGCGACPGPTWTIYYRWQGDHVETFGGPPPETERD